ncbi:MAG TPA: hypothetical protein VH063_06685 [Gaiellaceae bacterium]|jgi:hypothetical protein|nr:hypothetical protein [Gaiellaceae bacterium]
MGLPKLLAAPVAAIAAAVLVLPAGAGQSPGRPIFAVGGDYQFLAQSNNLSFAASGLERGAAPAAIQIEVPSQYRLAPAHAVGAKLGAAALTALPAKGKALSYTGQLVVASAGGFAALSRASGCQGGHHSAYWNLVLAGRDGAIRLPVALDRSALGTRLTVCLGGLAAKELRASSVSFGTSGTFRNPADTGTYYIAALVIPAGTDGKPDAAKGYEMLAADLVPQQISIEATRTAASGMLEVVGAVRGGGYVRAHVPVYVYGGATANSSSWHRIGRAATREDGSYTLARHVAGIKYLFAYVGSSSAKKCAEAAASVGRCVSETTGGISSVAVAVATA